MHAYDRIARVIRYLDAHYDTQPDLALLAAQAQLSPHRFHRLFTAWAGVTPKDFLQCLTVAHAKSALREGASVLQAALASGLSGPGRLHDLCVSMEAATPGEWKSGGAGQVIVYGRAVSPFGACLIGESARGICHLAFIEPDGLMRAAAALRAAWPHAVLKREDAHAQQIAQRVFRSDPSAAALPLRAYVCGTPFQVRVWRALVSIPPGARMSYGALAMAAGAPGAARAVGTAVGRNPLAYLIPCHRVIRETGLVGGYRWGTTRKRAMLAWESARDRATA